MVKTTTKSRRGILRVGLFGACICLAIAIGLALNRRKDRPQLPAGSNYEKLPGVFNKTLQAARARVDLDGKDSETVRKLARLYQANRLYDEARACFRVIGTMSAGLTARDHYYLADIAQNQGDLAGAQNELRAVLKSEPRYLPARLTLAEVLFKSGQDNEAAKEYAAVLAIEGDHPQASLGLARIALQQGNDDAAVSRLEGLLASHPESTSGAALLAQVLDRRGEAERAAALTQWSRQKQEPVPADPWMSALLADCYDLQRLALKFEEYLKAGQMDEALPFLERVEELDPTSPIPKLLSGWSQARAVHHIKAVQEYYEALGKGGDPELICPLLVRSLSALEKLPEAATLMAGYYAEKPDSIPILTLYADVAARRGDDKMARSLLTKLLQKEPYLYTPNMQLAKILWTSGERDGAVQCLQRIVKVFPVDVASRGLLAQYYLEKSDPSSAIAPLEQAIGHAPAHSPAQERLTAMLDAAYRQTGNAEMEHGRYAEAVNYYEKAIRLAPADLNAHAGKANACVQLKQFRRAAEALERMAAMQPENPTIYLSLGDVLYQDGAAEEARRSWQKAFQLAAAGDTEIQSALALRLSGRISADTFK